MKISLLVITCLAVGKVISGGGYACTQYLKDTSAFYYLNKISKDPNDPYIVENLRLVLNGVNHMGTLKFNICEKVTKPVECEGNDEESTGYLITDEKKCFKFSAAKMTKWVISSLEGKKLPDGIKIVSDNSQYDGVHMDVHYRLVCDTAKEKPEFKAEQRAEVIIVNLESNVACGRDLLGPFPDLLSNKYVIYPAMIILGLIFTFVGIKVYKVLIVLLGFLLG